MKSRAFNLRLCTYSVLMLLYCFRLPAQEHVFRLNIFNLAFNGINIGYEYPLRSEAISVGLNFNMITKLDLSKGIPGNIQENLDESWQAGYFLPGMDISGFDIGPEIRWYFGKNAPQGLFVNIMLKYSKYSWDIPYHWIDKNNITFIYDGQTFTLRDIEIDVQTEANTNSIGAGFGVGHQWLLGERFILGADLNLGVGLGWGKGSMLPIGNSILVNNQSVEAYLNDFTRELILVQTAQNIADDINDGLESDWPFVELFDIEATAQKTQVSTQGSLPWPNFRVGLVFGFRL